MKQNYTFTLLLLFSLNMFAKDIYVAKNGDDSNPGTMESPYLTISKAASVAVAGDIVYIREGTYEETLTPANSGTPGNPIIFQSYPGEKVIISAMEALSGWTQDSGAIYKTTISFNSLGQGNFVVNDQTPLNLARWPNKTSNDPFILNSIRNT
ncbi:right-handed parallel beta-helix repeat-containing protein, partial [Seonamhaeicola marinus]